MCEFDLSKIRLLPLNKSVKIHIIQNCMKSWMVLHLALHVIRSFGISNGVWKLSPCIEDVPPPCTIRQVTFYLETFTYSVRENSYSLKSQNFHLQVLHLILIKIHSRMHCPIEGECVSTHCTYRLLWKMRIHKFLIKSVIIH